MSNPDSSTPSIQALDKAVKPAGYYWAKFERDYEPDEGPYKIALAYAADLDKADKVGRMLTGDLPDKSSYARSELKDLARKLILPDPIDPDLLEAAKDAHAQLFGSYMPDPDSSNINILMNLARRGRELQKEQDRG